MGSDGVVRPPACEQSLELLKHVFGPVREEPDALDGGDDQLDGGGHVQSLRPGPLLGAAPEEIGQGGTPTLLVPVDDRANGRVAAGAEVQLAQHDEQGRPLLDHPAQHREVVPELLGGAALGRHRPPELPGGVLDDARHQGLLRGEVVVERRMVDADLGGDVPQAQTLESLLGDAAKGGVHESLPASPTRTRLTRLVSDHDSALLPGPNQLVGRSLAGARCGCQPRSIHDTAEIHSMAKEASSRSTAAVG